MIEKKIVSLYAKEIEKYGTKDRRSLFWTKDKQDIRFNILLDENLKSSKMSILDFGCGIADLKGFLNRNLYNLKYNGCDINKEFIVEAQLQYPNENIFLIENSNDLENNYDIILVSGTFNLTGIDDESMMEEYIFNNLLNLFNKTDYMLSVNFLSHLTDKEYQYKKHFYMNPLKLYEFAIKHMTNRIKIDTSSLPYEITIKFYKNNSIDLQTVLYMDN